MLTMCSALFAVLLVAAAIPAETGWRASPGTVQHHQENRPGFIWTEEAVPDYTLPELLVRKDGTPVETAAEWPARRQELLELFRTHVYGRSPGAPERLSFEVLEQNPQALDGAATLKRVRITAGQGEREHSFELVLFTPNDRNGPAPTFLLLNNRGSRNIDPTRERQSSFWPAEAMISRGYGIAAINNREVAPDNAETWRSGIVSLFEASDEPRRDDAWGALAVWAWGGSRAMDYFETDADVDAKRVAVLGHSRGGKAALWAGVEDERFALVISNNSGCGGAALTRRRFGETLTAINNSFPHWFCDRFPTYNKNVDALPVDQHQLLALIAPRAVYVASADQDLWADPRGEFLSLAHASPAFALFGSETIDENDMPSLDQPLVVGQMGYHIRTGGHTLSEWDWMRYADFADGLWQQ